MSKKMYWILGIIAFAILAFFAIGKFLDINYRDMAQECEKNTTKQWNRDAMKCEEKNIIVK